MTIGIGVEVEGCGRLEWKGGGGKVGSEFALVFQMLIDVCAGFVLHVEAFVKRNLFVEGGNIPSRPRPWSRLWSVLYYRG